MIDPVQILWTPAGQNLPSLGSKALVDVTDGDTPNVRMPIRMLSIDTPEVTASSEAGAKKIDARFSKLAGWLKDGTAPVSAAFRDYILPKLETVAAGSLQLEQGQAASAFYKAKIEERLTRPGSTRKRSLFVRSTDDPFDEFGRLLAYVAPSYSRAERESMTRAERATFNLDLIESGWAAPFILFPSIPGELDLTLFLAHAVDAIENARGQYADPLSLPGYEYRMCEKLYRIAKKLDDGDDLSWPEQLEWRSRYCADMRTRELRTPEDYMSIPIAYRLWIWPQDLQRAIGLLNLVPQL